MEILNHLEELQLSSLKEISDAKTSEEIDAVRLKYLGKKGSISGVLKTLGTLLPEERKKVGESVNVSRDLLVKKIEEKLASLKRSEEEQILSNESIDVTLPVKMPLLTSRTGHLHPLSTVQRELEDIFLGLGFDVVDGPEVESEFFNFEALNVPAWHPARDMQDTIWTSIPGLLMRTQTSPIQVRAMLERNGFDNNGQKKQGPLRIVAPGRVFRFERVDATHGHTFYQMEGMMIDKEVTVGHLIYFMKTLLRKIFKFEPKIRLRPGYFPFVEPGFELDIWFNNKWMELLPCGLVHPKVLSYGGINPNEWQGFAFGLGLSRLVMSRYQINDIRHFQGGDFRFLNQF